MSVSRFNLPDVGEGLTEAEIVRWKVKPGDTVRVNDVIVEIETVKSLVELPCPFAGVVDSLLVDEGATVPVGTPIIAVRTGDGSVSDRSAPVGQPGGEQAAQASRPVDAPSGETAGEVVSKPSGEAVDAASDERHTVLVGYGPRTTAAKRRVRKAGARVRSANLPAGHAETRETVAAGELARTDVVPDVVPDTSPRSAAALAKPPVRKLAKDLGVDLSSLSPTGSGGTITRQDVTSAAGGSQLVKDHRRTGGGESGATTAESNGWDGLPRTERIPIRSVRKATAQAVSQSAFTAPHVTVFLTVDVTRTVKLVKRLRESPEFTGVKLSPMAVLAKAVCVAARRNPDVNSRWDSDAGEIVVQRFVNLGIAAATPRGLVVPNIKDADRLSLRELATSINEVAAAARDGKTPPPDMLGGTISITNIGVFGIDSGTPILPPGEAAIVAFGAIRRQPWVHKGKVRARWVTTLGLSFDHRLVDGEQGSRFLAEIGTLLEDPGNALAWS